MSKRTYTIQLENGNIKTRKSARVYTHAVVSSVSVEAYCGSLILAEKQLRKLKNIAANPETIFAKYTDGGRTLRIIELD